jgi:hypothetical protein
VPFPHMRKITHLYAAPGGALLSQQDVLCSLLAQITPNHSLDQQTRLRVPPRI